MIFDVFVFFTLKQVSVISYLKALKGPEKKLAQKDLDLLSISFYLLLLSDKIASSGQCLGACNRQAAALPGLLRDNIKRSTSLGIFADWDCTRNPSGTVSPHGSLQQDGLHEVLLSN